MKNPITALSDLLSKLVIERGSAVITEKNLAFLRDQLTATEKQITVLTAALENCKSEKQNFKTQLQNENKKFKLNGVCANEADEQMIRFFSLFPFKLKALTSESNSTPRGSAHPPRCAE